MVQVSRIRALAASDFAIYSGNDTDTLPILSIGGIGVISVAGHLIPGMIKDMIEAYKSGHNTRAKDLHIRMMPLFDALFADTNPIPVKYAVSLMGLPAGPLRLPLVQVQDETARRVREAMSGLGLI